MASNENVSAKMSPAKFIFARKVRSSFDKFLAGHKKFDKSQLLNQIISAIRFSLKVLSPVRKLAGIILHLGSMMFIFEYG